MTERELRVVGKAFELYNNDQLAATLPYEINPI